MPQQIFVPSGGFQSSFGVDVPLQAHIDAAMRSGVRVKRFVKSKDGKQRIKLFGRMEVTMKDLKQDFPDAPFEEGEYGKPTTISASHLPEPLKKTYLNMASITSVPKEPIKYCYVKAAMSKINAGENLSMADYQDLWGPFHNLHFVDHEWAEFLRQKRTIDILRMFARVHPEKAKTVLDEVEVRGPRITATSHDYRPGVAPSLGYRSRPTELAHSRRTVEAFMERNWLCAKFQIRWAETPALVQSVRDAINAMMYSNQLTTLKHLVDTLVSMGTENFFRSPNQPENAETNSKTREAIVSMFRNFCTGNQASKFSKVVELVVRASQERGYKPDVIIGDSKGFANFLTRSNFEVKGPPQRDGKDAYVPLPSHVGPVELYRTVDDVKICPIPDFKTTDGEFFNPLENKCYRGYVFDFLPPVLSSKECLAYKSKDNEMTFYTAEDRHVKAFTLPKSDQLNMCGVFFNDKPSVYGFEALKAIYLKAKREAPADAKFDEDQKFREEAPVTLPIYPFLDVMGIADNVCKVVAQGGRRLIAEMDRLPQTTPGGPNWMNHPTTFHQDMQTQTIFTLFQIGPVDYMVNMNFVHQGTRYINIIQRDQKGAYDNFSVLSDRAPDSEIQSVFPSNFTDVKRMVVARSVFEAKDSAQKKILWDQAKASSTPTHYIPEFANDPRSDARAKFVSPANIATLQRLLSIGYRENKEADMRFVVNDWVLKNASYTGTWDGKNFSTGTALSAAEQQAALSRYAALQTELLSADASLEPLAREKLSTVAVTVKTLEWFYRNDLQVPFRFPVVMYRACFNTSTQVAFVSSRLGGSVLKTKTSPRVMGTAVICATDVAMVTGTSLDTNTTTICIGNTTGVIPVLPESASIYPHVISRGLESGMGVGVLDPQNPQDRRRFTSSDSVDMGDGKDLLVLMVGLTEKAHPIMDLTGRLHSSLGVAEDQDHYSTSQFFANLWNIKHQSESQFGQAQFQDPYFGRVTTMVSGTFVDGLGKKHIGVATEGMSYEAMSALVSGDTNGRFDSFESSTSIHMQQ